MKLFLLAAAVLALVGQSVALSYSGGPGITYTLIAGYNCKFYYRDINGDVTLEECPADLRFNVHPMVCGCDSSNFVCPI